MQVYILKESNSDSRVAASPETVKKMMDWGLNVVVQDNAGSNSNFSNEDYVKSGALISSAISDISKSDLIIKIVVKTNNKLVLKPKLDEAKTLGIKINITNGLTTPPVK